MAPASGRQTNDAKATSKTSPPEGEAGTVFVGEIGEGIARLRKELQDYVAIKVARIKLSIWQKLLWTVAVTLGAVLAVALLVTGVVFLFAGIAGGIGEATGRPWLGSLLAGAIGLSTVAIAFLVVRGVLLRRASQEAGESIDEKSS